MTRIRTTRLLRAGAACLAAATAISLGAAGPALAASPAGAGTATTTRTHVAVTTHAPAPVVPAASSKKPGPTGVSAAGTNADTVQQGRLSVNELPPRRPTVATSTSSPNAAGARGARPDQSCTPADFAGLSGSALAAYIETSTTDCINTLFSVTGSDAHGVFQESQMIPVAQAFQSLSGTYSGDDTSGIWQLVLYLRAGYYVQYYDPTDVGVYDATLTNATVAGLNAFFASAHSQDVSEANGGILGDVVILTDSATVQQDFLSQYAQILNAYSSSWDQFYEMDAVVYDVYTPLWRGQYNPAFVTAITQNQSIITTLDQFALNHTSELGGDNTFMDADAGNDVATYVQFSALQSTVKPLMLGLLQASHISGDTAALWVSVAQQANSYDAANCSYYGVCNLVAQLTAAALPTKYTCTSTITITAEALTADQLAAVCTSLSNQVPWFQNLVKATGPISGQIITGENMNVFSSQLNYQVYAGAIYGVSTDNGGITVTGDPTQAGNSSYSLMYQAPYATDFTADIWNLNHEFTHYLDAVFDTKGSFTDETAVPDVWWIEGIAEYTSYTYRNVVDTEAVQDAALHTYALSTLFQNTYENSDETRTYPWGYLAVRYMWEKHPDVMYSMLGYMRTGDYTDAYNIYNSIGTADDADFNSWLDTIAATSGPTAAFTDSVSGLNATFTDQSTESGTGSITGWAWNFGDNATSTTQDPTHTYAAAGTYAVTLTVTDSNGLTSTSTGSVTVSGSSGGLGPCADSNVQQMDQNCYRSGQAEAAGNYDYLWIYLPAGTTKLSITTKGGSGTAYLYYDPSKWATASAHTSQSTKSGTAQSITVTNTTAGYRYISLYAHTAFSGVTVTTQY